MTTTNNKLATLLAELDTLESQRRSMLEEYMPIKNRITELNDEKELLEEQLLSEEQVVDDARFDEVIDSFNEVIDSFNNIMGNPMDSLSKLSIVEENQLIDEIKNPEDYVDADIKDLESSQ